MEPLIPESRRDDKTVSATVIVQLDTLTKLPVLYEEYIEGDLLVRRSLKSYHTPNSIQPRSLDEEFKGAVLLSKWQAEQQRKELKDSDPLKRRQALMLIATRNENKEDLLRMLADALHDDDAGVVIYAVLTLEGLAADGHGGAEVALYSALQTCDIQWKRKIILEALKDLKVFHQTQRK